MKYIISTLGCKVNQFETQAMETRLQEHGHTPCAPGEIADAVIVNTCAVTAESGRKSRQLLRRLRDENPGAVLAVCGCYAQLEPQEAAEIGAGVIFGAADRMAFVEAVEKAVAAGESARSIDEPFRRRTLEKLPAGAMEGRTRAMHCIEAVAAEAGDMRIRLGSLEPTVITEDFCRRLAETGKMCRHFHLSLQSGCDRTLKAMNRKYDTAFFLERCELLRRYFPGCALTCDLITGFPGETEGRKANKKGRSIASFYLSCQKSSKSCAVVLYTGPRGSPSTRSSMPSMSHTSSNTVRPSKAL